MHNYANSAVYAVRDGDGAVLWLMGTTTKGVLALNQFCYKYRRWAAGEGAYCDNFSKISDINALSVLLLCRAPCRTKSELNLIVSRLERGGCAEEPVATLESRLEAARVSKRALAKSTLARYKATLANIMADMATDNPNVFEDSEMVIDYVESMICSIDSRRRAYKALSFVSAAESAALADYAAAAAATA